MTFGFLLINSIVILYKTYLFNNLWKYTHSVQHTSFSIHKMLLHCKVEFTSLFFSRIFTYNHVFSLYIFLSKQVHVTTSDKSRSFRSTRRYLYQIHRENMLYISDKIFLYSGIERNSRSN